MVTPDGRRTNATRTGGEPQGLKLHDDRTHKIGDFNAREVIAVPIISPGVIDGGFAHVAAQLSGGGAPTAWRPPPTAMSTLPTTWARRSWCSIRAASSSVTIPLPEDAGAQTTNVAFDDGHLYITEAGRNEVWRGKMNVEGTKLH